MTTKKQASSNRRNAMHSTGPRTPEGKAVVAGNARKHGLSARDSVLSEEDEILFTDMLMELVASCGPEGELETFLVKRIATGIWRLQRLLRVEAGLFDEPGTSVFNRDKGPGARFNAQIRYGSNPFATLCRYESALERGVYRAVHELQRTQAARRGEEASPPLALDVLLSTGGRA